MRVPLMRTVLLALTAAVLGVSSAFLVACGDRNDLIPGDDASALQSNLDRAQVACERGNQGAALSAVGAAQDQASRLPPQVDAKLRRTLGENLDVVREKVAADCRRTQTTQSTQTTVTTPTTPPTTTTTPPTTTTAPPTTTTAPPTTTTAPPTTDTGDSGGTPPGQESRNRGRGKEKNRKHGKAEDGEG
jgi:hypothetical protein